MPGSWDINCTPFEDLDVFSAMRNVLVDHLPWNETEWYQEVLRRLDDGEVFWGCDESSFRKRCEYLEELFGSIASRGYMSQQQLVEQGLRSDIGEEIAIAIARDGRLLFSDGAHRLAIAKMLGIPYVPVQIAVRHEGWRRTRERAAAYVESAGGVLYQRPMHPDLEGFPHAHSCEDRLELITEFLESREGSVLDIGANWGYFCHRFEEMGFSCYAVESEIANVYFMTLIRDAIGRTFEVLPVSILGSPEVVCRRYSVVLALNIFHHFLKSRSEFELFERLLASLECDEMYLEPHAPDEPQMRGAHAEMSPEDLVRFVSERCSLPRVMRLGEVSDGRSLYRLSRR